MNRLFMLLLFMTTLALAGVKTFNAGKLTVKLPAQFKLDTSKPGNYTGTFTAIDYYTEELSQNWSTDLNGWVDYSKTVTIYDPVAGTVTIIEQSETGGQLINSDKYVMYVELNLTDSTFKFLKTEYYSWTETGWALEGRTIYEYDENSFLRSVTTQFEVLPGQFSDISKTTYINNAAGNPLVSLYEQYNFQTGQWYNSMKIEFVYKADDMQYLESGTEYVWDLDRWREFSRSLYTRNALRSQTEVLRQRYADGTFQNVMKDVYTYLPDGVTVDSNYAYDWVTLTSTWEPTTMYRFVYNAQGHADVINFYYWGITGWESMSKSSYLYDALGRETEELYQIWEGTQYRNEFRRSTVYTPASAEEETAPASFTLKNNFPNPFNPSTTIEYEVTNAGMITLTVYNLLGQKVAVLQNGYQQAGVYKVRFDGAGLTSGVYLYELAAGNVKVTKKMILNK